MSEIQDTKDLLGSAWAVRAERLLEKALEELRGGYDAIPTVCAAAIVLGIEAGDIPEWEMDGFPFPGEDDADESACTCPPDLRERGGFRSSCPSCGTWPSEVSEQTS